MRLGFALHEIIRGKETLRVGAVHDFSDADFDDMTKLGAVRAATEQEEALFGLGKPKEVAPEPDTSARDLLEQEAVGLGVKFQKNTSDEKLAERIAEARAAASVDTDPEVQETL